MCSNPLTAQRQGDFGDLGWDMQITWDKGKRLPKLEEVDAPLELFKADAGRASLFMKQLLVREPAQHARDMGTEGSFLILAFAWQEAALDSL